MSPWPACLANSWIIRSRVQRMLTIPWRGLSLVSSRSKRDAITRDRWLARSNSAMTSVSDSSSATANVPSSRLEYPSHSNSSSPAQNRWNQIRSAAAACLINEIGVVSDATSCRRASASDSPRAVSMSASRLRSSMFSTIARSVPLVIRLVLMGFTPFCCVVEARAVCIGRLNDTKRRCSDRSRERDEASGVRERPGKREALAARIADRAWTMRASTPQPRPVRRPAAWGQYLVDFDSGLHVDDGAGEVDPGRFWGHPERGRDELGVHGVDEGAERFALVGPAPVVAGVWAIGSCAHVTIHVTRTRPVDLSSY